MMMIMIMMNVMIGERELREHVIDADYVGLLRCATQA